MVHYRRLNGRIAKLALPSTARTLDDSLIKKTAFVVAAEIPERFYCVISRRFRPSVPLAVTIIEQARMLNSAPNHHSRLFASHCSYVARANYSARAASMDARQHHRAFDESIDA